METIAEPGGICVSGNVHDFVDGKVDLRFEDIGEQQVKNIAKPVRAYRVEMGAATPSLAASEKPLALPDKPSIAVLPFANLGGDPEQEYFADGIAEDLITALSRLRWLFVTARNSTFTYKGQAVDVKRAGRELGVRYVLEGSVRKSGNRARITAQLIDALTGNHIWAHRYDRDLADIFAVQDEITETIVAAIEPELSDVEQERARRKPPENLSAWESYQKGLWHQYRMTKDDNRQAQVLFRRAHELDPGFAPAAAGLAFSLASDVTLGFAESREDSIEDALRWGRMAVAMDDRDAMSRFGLGRAYFASGDADSSIAEFERAIQSNPSHAQTHYGLGISLLTLAGRAEDAIPEFEMAARLSPHDPVGWAFLMGKAMALMTLERDDEALAYARDAVRHPNAAWLAHTVLIAILGHLGRIEEARGPLAKLHELHADLSPARIKEIIPGPDGPFARRFLDGWRKAGLDIPDEPATAD
jgi:TolB-like protein